MLHRQAVTLDLAEKSFDAPVIRPFSAMVEAGEKIAIIGANGAGKTTLLRMLALDLASDRGSVKWSENADLGYMAQDVSELFMDKDSNLFEWMTHYRQPSDDDQSIRSVLGRLLFSADDLPKAPHVLSGGEKNRMTFGRLMLKKHNVMLLDEPTNHLDMESIESLQLALDKYPGTLFFVSHDREFVSALATRIWEIQTTGHVIDYRGPYEEFLSSKGIED
jgi:ATPase subunit of ABC transporter with duplicated ATPase domains